MQNFYQWDLDQIILRKTIKDENELRTYKGGKSMRMYDLIEKKKKGQELSKAEIEEMIVQYVKGTIPDYQMAAWLMAVYFQGMTDEELGTLTLAMAHSGEMVDLSAIEGVKVDKHSTGGVGDKTTLAIAPIVAACGEKVAKMSGRGLGHTGGTIDKLESIPGFQTEVAIEEFFQTVNQIGLSIIGQSGDLAPADKKLYALRDVTATVDSIPLIAASVMSKKIAAGSDKILLDVTCGSGAFMKNKEDAVTLAQKMVAIGERAGRPTIALITNMDTPLGEQIGNSMEVAEVVELLKGNGKADLLEVCLALASNMLYLAKNGDTETISLEECKKMAEQAITDGTAFEKLIAMVQAQHGDTSVIEDTSKFAKADYYYDVVALHSGYITHIDTAKCGVASMVLGAGRETKESEIDFAAGIKMAKKTGDKVEVGDTLVTLYSNQYDGIRDAEKIIKEAYEIGEQASTEEKLIIARVTKDGVTWY